MCIRDRVNFVACYGPCAAENNKIKICLMLCVTVFVLRVMFFLLHVASFCLQSTSDAVLFT